MYFEHSYISSIPRSSIFRTAKRLARRILTIPPDKPSAGVPSLHHPHLLDAAQGKSVRVSARVPIIFGRGCTQSWPPMAFRVSLASVVLGLRRFRLDGVFLTI